MKTIKDTILETYAGEQFEFCTNKDSEFKSLCENEEMMIIKNPFRKDADLYIFILDNKFTIIFGNWSCHFEKDSNGETRLLHALDLILNRQACIYSVYNRSFILSVLCHENRAFFCADSKIRLEAMFKNKDFLEDAAKGRVRIETLYWDKTDHL